MEYTDRLAFSVGEARKLLGLSRGLIYEAIRTGQISSVRIGRRILIPRAALEKLLANPGNKR
jgi:excisionase family DNA binding protein